MISPKAEPLLFRKFRLEAHFPPERRCASLVQLRRLYSGFTLIELLVVIGIMVLMIGLIGPVMTSLRRDQEVSQAVYDIRGAFDRARAYAMANGTYVYVGLVEVDASVSKTTVPQVAASGSTGGRVAVAVVASRNGGKHFADRASGQGSEWTANYGNGAQPEYLGGHLVPVGKLEVFEGVHLASSLPDPGTGGMHREVGIASTEQVGHSACTSALAFTWPLGSALDSGYQYRFDKVIMFGPQGTARIVRADNGTAIPQWIEVGLVGTQGDRVPDIPTDGTGNQAAIQINGITGATFIFRP